MLSVDEMMLSCCSSASFVSRGKFNTFCLWFADKFDINASEWRPDTSVRLMNTCKYYFDKTTHLMRLPLSFLSWL